jgi:D-alanyl-D-alanine carboxypeptidase
VAEDLPDLRPAVPARSELIGDRQHPVAGRYHPRWVGHRTMLTSARQLHRFWSNPPGAFLDTKTYLKVGDEVPGFMVRPSYGIGVMADPLSPIGLIIGHGGGGPGYSAGAFAAPSKAAVAVVLEPAEGFPAQELAVELLRTAVSGHP